MRVDSAKERIKQAVETIRLETSDRTVKLSLCPDDVIEMEVSPGDLVAKAFRLRDHPELLFDYLSCVSGVDRLDRMEVVYHVHSLKHGLTLRLKAVLDISEPTSESLVPVWPGANWHEREAYDLFGIKFVGHPNLRRIMLEDDFPGHPMRKSYTQPQGRVTP